MLLAGLLAAPPVLAKSTDRLQPMDVDADNMDALITDDSVSVLQGNVRIRQGTLEVDAARAEIHQVGGGTQRIVLTGAPVRLRQLGDNGEPTEASAAQIVYLLGDERMVLTGDVLIRQTRGDLRGETIKYDINTGRLDGGGDGRRVSMRILPKTPAAPVATPESVPPAAPAAPATPPPTDD